MDDNRKISTPEFFNNSNFPRPFPFRSLRVEKKERGTITKQPSISVIMEQSENESIENNQNVANIDNNEFKTRRESLQNQSQQSKKSNKSMKSVKSQSHVYINRAYYTSRASNPDLHTSTSTLQSSRVVREQYWSCKGCCCKNWTKREKILVLIVGSLIGLIFGLGSVIGVISEAKNNGTNNDRATGWRSWKL